MSRRILKYQSDDGKWYEIAVNDIIDPISESTLNSLRTQLSACQKGLAEEVEKSGQMLFEIQLLQRQLAKAKDFIAEQNNMYTKIACQLAEKDKEIERLRDENANLTRVKKNTDYIKDYES